MLLLSTKVTSVAIEHFNIIAGGLMREKLVKGQVLKFETNQKYIINDLIGEGASCLVYEAGYLDEIGLIRKVRIKELYPVDGCALTRANGNIIWDNEEIKEQYFLDFEKLYKRQISFQNMSSFTNSSSVITDMLLEANNTKYIVLDCSGGQTFDRYTPKSIQEILKIALALATLCQKYHENGYLLLDIKPENFLTIHETNELIKYLDFDSIVSKWELKQNNTTLSFSEKWAAPELMQSNINKISEKTDFYAIGAIIYNKIFGKYVTAKERSISFVPNYDESEYRSVINPKTYILLNDFFNKTLSNNVNRRYENDDELINALKELVKVSDPKALFLNSTNIEQRIPFVGRKKELKLIDDAYKNKNVVIINGCGGIGKTELAKYYLISRKSQYHTIVFGKCTNGLKNLFKDDEISSISNYDVENNKVKILAQLVDENTLLCIDNLDVLEDPYLDKLMLFPCKILITTRANLDGIISESVSTIVLTLNIMSYEDLEKIFYQYYTKRISSEEMEYVTRIIQQIGGLSLMVPILAKQMMLEDYLPSEMYEQFKSNHLKGISNTLVKHFKDNKLINATAYNQALQIFEVFSLNDDEKVVLYILALLGNIKISKRTLAAFAGQFKKGFDSKRRTYEEVQPWLSDLNKNADLRIINSLIDKGYLEVEAKTQYVFAHNIIREISLFEFDFTIENCQFFKELMVNVYNQVLYSFIQENDYSYSIFEYYLELDFFEILNKITYNTFIEMFIQMIKNMDFTRVENRKFIFKQLQFLPTVAETYFQDIRDKWDRNNIVSLLNKDEEMDYLLFVIASEMNDKRYTDFSGRNVLKDRFTEEFERILDIYKRDHYEHNIELPYKLLLSLSFSGASEFGYKYNHDTIEILYKIFENLQEVYDKSAFYTQNELKNNFTSLYEDMEFDKKVKELKESLHPKKVELSVSVDSQEIIAENEEIEEVKHMFDPYVEVFDMLTNPFIAKMDKGIQLPLEMFIIKFIALVWIIIFVIEINKFKLFMTIQIWNGTFIFV